MNTKEQSTAFENSQKNAQEIDNKNSSLVEYKVIEETPFTIATVETKRGKEYHVLMGKYRTTRAPLKTMEEAKTKTKLTWENIIPVIGIIAEELKNEK